MTHSLPRQILAVLLLLFLAGSTVPLAAREPSPATIAEDGEDGARGDGMDDLPALLRDARSRKTGALTAFCRYLLREGEESLQEGLSAEDQATVALLLPLARPVNQAMELATTFLGDPDNTAGRFRPMLRAVLADDIPDDELAAEALELVLTARDQARELVRQRETIFARLGREGETGKGLRLAWSLIRAGAARPDTAIDPDSFAYDDNGARMRLRHMDAVISVDLRADDYQNTIAADVDGYRFRTGWAVLMQKPFGWMAAMAPAMRSAGVPADLFPEWTLMEAPEGLIALAPRPTAMPVTCRRRPFSRVRSDPSPRSPPRPRRRRCATNSSRRRGVFMTA